MGRLGDGKRSDVIRMAWAKFWQNLQILQNVLFDNPIEIEWKIECMYFFFSSYR